MAEGLSDGNLYAACMESALVHARSLVQFLDTKNKRYDDDIVPDDFALGWKPPQSEAFERLTAFIPAIHKHLMHLTWASVRDKTPTDYHEKEMAFDVHEVMGEWVAFAENANAPGAPQFRFAFDHATTTLGMARQAEWNTKKLEPRK